MTVSSQIIEVLNDLCMKFGMAIDWSQENILPYLEELAGKYISWEIATSWVWIGIGALFFILGVGTFILGIHKRHEWDPDSVIITILLSVFFTIIPALLIIGFQIFDIVECNVFPEKALFEYVQTLLRK